MNIKCALIAVAIAMPVLVAAQTTSTDTKNREDGAPMSKTLNEVVVSGDKSTIVTRTANGQRFYLSKEAKESGNPFLALKEIPVIVSNDATNMVTMLDSTTPKILIDGNWVNSGISPINPQDIESVEVIDAPDARFLKEGYKNVINIRLKKNRSPYVYFEAATRHEIPAREGFGVMYFEVGNKNVSLYGRTALNYTHDDKTTSEIKRETDVYKQAFGQTSVNNGHYWLGELILKWRITDKDYFAVMGYGKTERFKSAVAGDGNIETSMLSPYTYHSQNKDNGNVYTGSAYYRHTFCAGKDLEVRFAYNYNDNENSADRRDVYPDYIGINDFRYMSNRHSGSLSIDYSGGAFALGSKTSANFDEIDLVSSNYPVFKHRRWNEFLYGSYYGKVGKMQYMLSAGVDYVWLKAGDVDNSYIRPRGSLSSTYSINDNNSLQLSYSLNNTYPSEGLLNPYNTSTDSLVKEVGNPYLAPMMAHTVGLDYTFNKKGLYIGPGIHFGRVTDVVEAYGYTENGIYTNSYRNYGYNSILKAGADISYRIGKWGRVYGGGYWYRDWYPGMSAKDAYSVNFGFDARYKKLFFNVGVTYQNKSYTPTGQVRYNTPTYASAQVNYNIKKNLYVAVCVQSLSAWSNTSIVNDGNFCSWNESKHTSAWHPWLLIRYSFRKNVKKKINLGNVLGNEEQGISLSKKK